MQEQMARWQVQYRRRRAALCGRGSLVGFADGYRYFGLHPHPLGMMYREWAPMADGLWVQANGREYPMTRIGGGVWQGVLPRLPLGTRVRTVVQRGRERLFRISGYATRVEQDGESWEWCAVVDDALYDNFKWTDKDFRPTDPLRIYECHIGMAQQEGRVGSFDEFTDKVLPRIAAGGYNTVQIMAVAEHPYYASFGYQVSSFYAVSSRFGRARDFKRLVNEAHRLGLRVLLDVVHSHACANEAEGLCRFDGGDYPLFRKGRHPLWGTCLFDYGRRETLHFLLSNLRYWLEVFHLDGFRFDGVSSMLYRDHGLRAFESEADYLDGRLDEAALTYLMLANELVHTVRPWALTVAEEVSGLPYLCRPLGEGVGFDWRLAMGVPDFWIGQLTVRDEDWDMERLWWELTRRREGERSIGYAESHDQALVGDKTLMFRLCDRAMYTQMDRACQSAVIERGMALHKMIRLLTATAAGEGYLNFMGNEFGHPEWIDFPREGNGWSYQHCRRRWDLADNGYLRYGLLAAFDRAMLPFVGEEKPVRQWVHQADKVLMYTKGEAVFAFNFHPTQDFTDYFVPVARAGWYRVVLDTDADAFGGCGRIRKSRVRTMVSADGRLGFFCDLPCRTAIVWQKEKPLIQAVRGDE